MFFYLAMTAVRPLPHYQSLRFLRGGVPAMLIICGAIVSESVLPRLGALKAVGNEPNALYLVHASVLNLTSHLHLARPVVVVLAVGPASRPVWRCTWSKPACVRRAAVARRQTWSR